MQLEDCDLKQSVCGPFPRYVAEHDKTNDEKEKFETLFRLELEAESEVLNPYSASR
jgi:hypothetical protein